MPQNDQIWPKTGIFGQFGPGHAGLFSALLVGRLVVVARGLYLARRLFTLLSCPGQLKSTEQPENVLSSTHYDNSSYISFSMLSLQQLPEEQRKYYP